MDVFKHYNNFFNFCVKFILKIIKFDASMLEKFSIYDSNILDTGITEVV